MGTTCRHATSVRANGDGNAGRAGALAVVPREVVNAVCGDGAADTGVGSVVIVVMEPVPVGRSTGLVAGVGAGVSPLGREGAI